MPVAEWKIAVGEESTRAVYEPATTDHERAVYAFAHGAGGNMSDRAMLAATKTLRAFGLGVVRFNLLYKERGSGRPDQMPKLMATTQAVVERVRAELGPQTLIIGGRSMGGRAASMLAAEGFDADGLLLLAYPLHPEGAPEKLRDAHLPRIRMPVLCFNGTRDGLCTPELMEGVLTSVVAPWQMHWLDGADHSFHVLKSSGRNDAAVLTEVGSVTSEWIGGLAAELRKSGTTDI
jgi:predicted alpha/beta-hydrolase family hydrolase